MKISVSFLGFSSVEKLETAIQTAKAQTVNAELELIVCDPEAVLNNNKMEQLCTTYLAVCCKDASDPMGFCVHPVNISQFTKTVLTGPMPTSWSGRLRF